jgi:hypothetical protein
MLGIRGPEGAVSCGYDNSQHHLRMMRDWIVNPPKDESSLIVRMAVVPNVHATYYVQPKLFPGAAREKE